MTIELTRQDVPDCRFPSNNELGIPVLRLDRQADYVDSPFMQWGARAGRTSHMPGTYHFYTDDYRFTALWHAPHKLLNSGCVTAIEPNFSCFTDMAPAWVMHLVYQKRWLNRYWQENGVRTLVDLNVAPEHDRLNMIGVPEGWRSYATRGYSDMVGRLHEQYSLATERANSEDVLFVVYSGGKYVEMLCRERGWLYLDTRAHIPAKPQPEQKKEPEHVQLVFAM